MALCVGLSTRVQLKLLLLVFVQASAHPGSLSQSQRKAEESSTWSVRPDLVPEPRQIAGKRSCRQTGRHFSLSSALGGFAIGILLVVPVATTIVDYVSPVAAEKLPHPPPRPVHTDRAATYTPKLIEAADTSMELFWPRCASLVATLLIQSVSSVILATFQRMIEAHPTIILFLTTIVGLGGNAGCQSTVLTVRRLALGQDAVLAEQVWVGVLLSLIMGPLMLLRTLAQGAAWRTSWTIVVASMVITVTATTLGCAIPKFLWRLGIDPAHSASFIQVAMDILGILIVCLFGAVVLG